MTRSNDLAVKQEAMRLRKMQDSPEAKLQALPRFCDWLRQMQEDGVVSRECRCSRTLDALRPHCPNCGSQNTYALSAMEGLMATGEKLQTMRHRCRRCGLYFTDLQMYLHCEAGKPEPTMREVRRTEKANEAIKKAGFEDVDDFKQKLEEFRKKQESDKN